MRQNQKEAEGKEYPNFSLWVDENDQAQLHLLRHIPNKNRHWTIRTDTEDWQATMTETPLGRYGC